ncbi:phage portal protein [Methylobacterium sp. D53M]
MTGAFSGAWSAYSPGVPLAPIAPAQPIRGLDFPVSVNTQTAARSYEPFGFPQLRAFANVELVRLAIETRKDQVERLDWAVRPRKGALRGRPHDRDTRIRVVEKLLRRPDGVTPFATWLRILLEDLLVLDAPAIERRRNRGGGVIGYEVVDGGTIKVLVDERGRRPTAPLPAYQQVIKGIPWADLTTDDLIYTPRNPRSNHLYGYGPVEQVVVTLTTAMRRQATQLAYFTEGNTPAGLLSAPEGWTPEQIKDWQGWMDAKLTGQTGERSKQLWVPKDTKYTAFKDAPIKDEFDEWLARIVMFAFSLPPTPFVKQMNRATSENDAEQSEQQGLAPLLLWAKRLFDGIIQDDLGHPDLEFAWETARDVDPKVQAEIDDRNLRNGSERINEVRERRGQPPVPGGDTPRIYLTTGAIDLEANDAAVAAAQEVADRATKAPAPGAETDPPPDGGDDADDPADGVIDEAD